jgi:tetratricopeptide (TPR) repeat protein
MRSAAEAPDASLETRAAMGDIAASAGVARRAAARPRRPGGGRNLRTGASVDPRNKAGAATPSRAGIVQAQFERALEHHRAGRLAEAKALYEGILAIDKRHADSLHLLGMVAQAEGDLETAETLVRQALKLQPKADMYHNNLGNVLKDRRRFDEALAEYRLALRANPGNPWACTNIGACHADLGQFDQAIEQYERALRIQPDFYDALFNLALALRSTGRFERAEATLRRAIAAVPDKPEAHYTLAQLLLLLGRLDEGWPEYDWRWKLSAYAWLRGIHGPFAQPQWNGEPPHGRTILVYAEQGMGDAIQFMRYLPDVVARGARVVFAVHPRLRPLIGETPGVVTVDLDRTPLPPFDLHAPLLSLPRILGIRSVAEIRPAAPYLRAEPQRVAAWRARLAPLQGFRIGIAWQGNPHGLIDKGRSPPLAAFEALARIPGVTLVALQQQDGMDQLARLPAGMKVERPEGGVDTDGAFLDTAAIMECLDLVVVSDSAIAHVAGALGRPVWVPLQKVPDWRFLVDGESTRWYPTMRLFRQPAPGDWAGAFAAIAAALRAQLGIEGAAVAGAAAASAPADAGRMPLVPQSWGEIIDKITILEIKSEKLADPAKRANVRRELDALVAVRERHFPGHAALAAVAARLKAVNASLWEVEDDLRDCERNKDFGEKFVLLARAVYVTNDRRADVKREVNALLGSTLVEEKSYAAYAENLEQAAASLAAAARDLPGGQDAGGTR